MSIVTRFVPKAERIKAEQAEEARQAVLDLALPPSAESDMLVTIQRHETGGRSEEWNFMMLHPPQCLLVWNAIRADCIHPHETRAVFDYTITHIEPNTGIVTLTREELAEQIGIRPNKVSRSMGWLEKRGVIFRERVKVPGMKGPGKARYRINPHVGWNGKLELREVRAKQDTPVQDTLNLTVIDGGVPVPA